MSRILSNKSDQQRQSYASDNNINSLKLSYNQVLYLRLLGRKSVLDNSNNIFIKPLKPSPIKDSIIGLFTKETVEERKIRILLNNYKKILIQEQQQLNKSILIHKKRIIQQYLEFLNQEIKLLSWGLKFVLPYFKLQCWSRLIRSIRIYELTNDLCHIVQERYEKTLVYIQSFEETVNRKDKFSISIAEAYCLLPDQLINRDIELMKLSSGIKKLDEICSTNTKRFQEYEDEYIWNDQLIRRKLLLSILIRYSNLPNISMILPSIETNLSWKEYCDWYAKRSYLLQFIIGEFSDFIEDDREKEGRLFLRWYKSVLQYHINCLQKSNIHAYMTPTSTRSDLESKLINTYIKEKDLVDIDKDYINNSNTTTNNNTNNINNNRTISEGIVPLKTTSLSIKAFLKYFVEEILLLQYSIPIEYIDSLKLLLEALFFKRLHSFIYQYNSIEDYNKDQIWRKQCQLFRYIDPTTYDVPRKYLVGNETNHISSETITIANSNICKTTYNDKNTTNNDRNSNTNNDINTTNINVTTINSDDILYNQTSAFKKELSTKINHFNNNLSIIDRSGRNNSITSTPRNNVLSSYTSFIITNHLNRIEVADVILSNMNYNMNHITDKLDNNSNNHTVINNNNINTTTTNNNNNSNNNDTKHKVTFPKDKTILYDIYNNKHTCNCNHCLLCITSQRFQTLLYYTPIMQQQQYGCNYTRSSRVLSLLTITMTPSEMINILLLALKWLYRDTIDNSGSRDTIGADLLVPLFTLVLVNAQIPNMNNILKVLQLYGDYSEHGDISYMLANLEGSILFITQLEIPLEIKDLYNKDNNNCNSNNKNQINNNNISNSIKNQSSNNNYYSNHNEDNEEEDDELAMKALGEWLRDQNTMEDTITILQKEGWMS